MAKVISVMGESGSGKTTSCRNLDHKKTMYIDCDKKGLSWKGWRDQYNTSNKNYIKTDSVEMIQSVFRRMNDDFKHIEVIVIDTINGLMVADEMRRMKDKGYDKWQDLAACVWNLVCSAHDLRDDLTVIFLCHSQTERDDSGFAFTRIKTSGKKLDKIVLESKFTTVLLAKCVDGKYLFETRSNNSTTKTPMGAFEETEIENDMAKVLEALKEY